MHKPFLKWAGGKSRLAEKIVATFPNAQRLVEPFVGSASVFLNNPTQQALLADSNPDLIRLYHYLQKEEKAFIEYAKGFFVGNDEGTYYQKRELFNTTTDVRLKSALFIYLNRHGFNGLCRYNRSGGFNVPFGRYTAPNFPEKELLFFANATQAVDFYCGDFAEVFKKIRKGDVIYCDPPYLPLSSTSNFTDYAVGGFDFSQQEKLALLAKQAAKAGMRVIISNHDTPEARELYAGAEILVFEVPRMISSKASERGRAKELLAVFHG
jgi:DNA adenine methylase